MPGKTTQPKTLRESLNFLPRACQCLLWLEENPPALRASNDLFLGTHFQGGLHVDLHVATGTDAMLDRDERNPVLALEEPVVTIEEVFFDSVRESWSACFEFFLPCIQIFPTDDEGSHV